jgi:Mce-associated membrane protein
VAGERGRPRPAGPAPIADVKERAGERAAEPAEPGAEPAEPEAQLEAPTNGAVASGRRPSWLVAGSALLLAVTALGTSVVLWHAADNRRTLAGNQAFAASSARVIVEKMLGYDYKSFDRHTSEVSALLAGSFKQEFVHAATDVVKPLAVKNQAVVLANASEVSVMSSPDLVGQDKVKILAFVDQTTTSAKLERPQIDQNRVILTMSNVDGRWLVSKVEAF